MINKNNNPKTTTSMPSSAEFCLPFVVISLGMDGKTSFLISRLPGYQYPHYGLIICDLVRHVAKAFGVNEEFVWSWVERERRNPTTDLIGGILDAEGRRAR